MPLAARSAALTNYSDVARRFGLDPLKMLREFGLPPQCLVEPELRVPAHKVCQLLEASADRSGVEGFGLLMSEFRRPSNLGLVGLLISEQPTARHVVQSVVDNGRRLGDALVFSTEESGDVLILRQDLIVGRAVPVRQAIELTVGVSYALLRDALGPSWRPQRVCFTHEPPRDRSNHSRILGQSALDFRQEFNGIVLNRRMLDTRIPNADPGMVRLASKMLEVEPWARSQTDSAQVRDLVALLLSKGSCTVDQVAQHLEVDRRTVHRRLADAGTSFSEIVESVRRELAARYVSQPERALAEVAAMLGFSTPSAFSRWYRKAFGLAPSAHPRRRTVGRDGHE
jgi:AraC-like DNA-binding protein